jgi:hypothetical protein
MVSDMYNNNIWINFRDCLTVIRYQFKCFVRYINF